MSASTALPQPSRDVLIGLRASREFARKSSPGTEAPSERASTTPAGRVPSGSPREDSLTESEIRELDVLALGALRRVERASNGARKAATLQSLRSFRASRREFGLIASTGAIAASVQPWEGVIGVEGVITGDGRLIRRGALSWAALPLPLRLAEADHGGHDGAVIVGRIDSIERRGDGSIFARGVIDLGSEIGREAARLLRAGMLGGVSMDLDATTSAPRPAAGNRAALVTSAGRVRAATLVAIPAFDEARIALSEPGQTPVQMMPGHADDCGCDPRDGLPEFDSVPAIDAMRNPLASLKSANTRSHS